jgi:hypothetical protein
MPAVTTRRLGIRTIKLSVAYLAVGKFGACVSHGGRDVFAETLWDGFVNGEERWRAVGAVAAGDGFKVLVTCLRLPEPV